MGQLIGDVLAEGGELVGDALLGPDAHGLAGGVDGEQGMDRYRAVFI